MNKNEKKDRSPWWWLLGFPIVDILSVLIFILGTILDSRLYENANGYGHPAPVFTLLFSFGAVVFFAIGNLVVLIILIIAVVRADKNQKEQS
jgi:hypothetical protein